jgi:hypothetical protein
MTATVHVEAQAEEEATRYAATMRCPDDANFVPFSMDVDSIEEITAKGPRASARLLRVK